MDKLWDHLHQSSTLETLHQMSSENWSWSLQEHYHVRSTFSTWYWFDLDAEAPELLLVKMCDAIRYLRAFEWDTDQPNLHEEFLP